MSLDFLPFRTQNVELPRWIGDYELPELALNAASTAPPNFVYKGKRPCAEQFLFAPPTAGISKPGHETRERSWMQRWSAHKNHELRNARFPDSSRVAPLDWAPLRFNIAPVSANNPLIEWHLPPDSMTYNLTGSVQQSQDLLLEMLKDRFERVVDTLLRYRIGTLVDRVAKSDALFELYEEGLLTKGEVRRRGSIEPEDFYDELRAYRLRNASR